MTKVSSVSKTPISLSNRKSVFLREWWLIKVDKMESKLGVGGYTNRETLGSRGMRLLGSVSRDNHNKLENENEIQVFDSAPIAKRLDNNTLEAVDGIIITITGFLNKSHTLSNGFSPQVCDVFLCGFPCTWEDDYASAKSFHDKLCAAERSLPMSFNDLPVTRVRDLLMSTSTEESETCALTSIIVRDILKQQSIQLQTTVNRTTDSDEKASSEHEGGFTSNATTTTISSGDILKQQSIQLQTTVNRTTDSDEKASSEHEGGFTSNATTTISSGSKRKLTTSQKRYTLRCTQGRKNNT